MVPGGEERRIVTILFADLVGSTALAERLDPEETKLVLGEAVAQVIQVAESYGGHIKDIAGDGVLVLFGAPVAHEDDPERATRAALEIVQSVKAYSGEVSQAWGVGGLAVRIGIHTGEVVVGLVGASSRVEYGAVGDPVNVAARLQAAAEAGSVLLSEATRQLIAERFEWGPQRHLQLKGRSKPVIAYAVEGLATSASTRRESVNTPTPLIGRGAELQLLEDMVGAATKGQGGILVISGEPGIGKSRMTAELRKISTRRAVSTWLEGRCVSYGEALPYWPYRELLRNWLKIGGQDPEVRVRITLLRRLEEIFPHRSADTFPYLAGILGLRLEADAAARLAQVSPESIQYRTLEVVVELVSRLCSEGSVVIAIDDLHWADHTSLALTERLMAVTETAPLLLVLTTRPETDHPSWQLKERAAREYRHLYRELPLGPLGLEWETELLEVLAGDRPLPTEAKRRILEYSAGNAFYLEEIVRSVDELGISNGDSHEAVTIPRTIEGVLRARIDRLEPAWRDVLTAASVLGRSFPIELIGAVTGGDSAFVQGALHHLLRLGLIQYERSGPEPAFRFKHALIQDTAYRTLVAARRSLMHARAAQWFESFYAERLDRVYGLIAHHWRAADDTQRAAHYLRLAGDRAMREWALDEAIEHYRRLLPLLERREDEHEAAELLFQLASTLHLALRYREANEVWREAIARWTYPEPPAEEPTATFRIATYQVPWSAEPAGGYYATNQTLFQQLWDRLLEARPAPYLVPGLASRWEVSEDGLTYRISLRDGAVCNNGEPISASDVVRSLLWVVDPDHPGIDATALFAVENAEARSRGEVPAEAVGIRALDDRTVEIHLNRRVPHFLFHCVYPEFGAFRTDRASDGPFRLVSMAETNVIAEREAAYQRRRGGNVVRIEWILVRDPDRLAQAARKDEIDAVWGFANISCSLQEAGLTMLPTPQTHTGFIAFLGVGAFLSDRELRRALALAIDRESLAKSILEHEGIALGGLVPPGLPGHTPDIAPRFDPEAARRALSQSSHLGPVTFMVAVEHRQPYVDLVADMWRQHLGMEVIVRSEPMANNQDWASKCHAALWNWVAHAPDPDYFLRNLLHTKSLGKLGEWKLPRLDALLDQALDASDGALKLDLYHQADRLAVREECVVIPLIYAGIRWLVKPWVHGVWQWGAPWQSWDEVRIDESSPRYHPSEEVRGPRHRRPVLG